MSKLTGLKERMAGGEAVCGCWVMTSSNVAAEILAGTGFDCMMVDLEHAPGDLREAVNIIQASELRGAPCLMRVPANDPVWLKRALDIGVRGVMIPSIGSVAEAEAAVNACRYPPQGRRGMAASIVRASGYGADWQDYVARIDDELIVIAQIETREGLDAVEDIAAVDGVDMLFVGPFDLSANLGYLGQPDHPEVDKAIARIEAAAKASGKLLGAIDTPARTPAKLIERGYTMIICAADVMMLRAGGLAQVAAFRDIVKR